MSDRERSVSRDREAIIRSRRERRSSYGRSRSKSRSHSRLRSKHRHRHSRSTSRHRNSGHYRSSPRPTKIRNHHIPDRENPVPSFCLGVFGLSLYTTERELKEAFSKYGRIKDIQVVYDKKTNISRGFGFIYFDEVESATRAKEALNGTDLDNHKMRIDYSVTRRAHTPTPGIYMGKPTMPSYRRPYGSGYRRSPSYDRHHHRSSPRSRSRSRSRSPYSKSRRGGEKATHGRIK